MSDDCAWLQARLTKTEAMIEQTEDKILSLSAPSGAQSYELDDGQTRVRRTQLELDQLRLSLRELYSLRESLKAQLGCGVTHGVPGF
jgi:hypothetical protein